ncbi:phage baseplate assembly protein [Paraburkholderia sp. Cpub6]|uniref:phage baseplate assembly protein n=1 Tax=Paraburkholderia sp. Cpub6 TaxID=2723094 RepID=UPI00161CC6DD|nr:contractile injection system protein, VgrG/Pvc8 family [Paraburkholderia sp. Cpub6]MBB5462870.1 prophage tail gpP-like protein [Paraburkholderia sp. Cpub6]
MPNADRIVDAVGAAPGTDEVRVLLTQDGLLLTGWKAVRITRSIEFATSSFLLTCSADANTLKLVSREGAPVTISIGSDVVLAGYVETIETILTPTSHDITISGRGKLADLVDCSCRIDRINANTGLKALCASIATPYSVDVFVPPNGTQAVLDALPALPRQIVSITETAWEVIERYARYCGLLVYESEEGELTISQAGTELGGSGVALGSNIEAIVCTKSTLGTFSTYNAVLSAYSMGADDESIANLPVVTVAATGTAANPGRTRPTYFVSEQSATDRRFIEKRVNWMASRAYGRARRVRVLVDNWRDASGSPWLVNVNYPVSGALAGVPDNTILLLAEVTFILSEKGTHAELVFGPRQGFLPEPIALDVLPMDESTQTPTEQ